MVPLLDRDRASPHARRISTTPQNTRHRHASPPSHGLRPPPSGVLGQEIEEARFAEKFLNARGSADDPQHTVRSRGQVVDLNQLAYAAGVQFRHGRQIQLYSSNASAQDGVHRHTPNHG